MRSTAHVARVCAGGLILVALASGSMSGCTSSTSASSGGRRSAAEQQAQAARLELERYRLHIESGARESAAKDEQIAALRQQIEALQSRCDAISADYAQASAGRPSLPGPAVGKLRQFVRDHEQMVRFEEDEAMLVLPSDRMFQPGRDGLGHEAGALLAALTSSLGDSDMAELAVHVVVHSDAKPVADTSAAQLRRDAWEFTNRRALAVGGALASAGLALERITAHGEGDRTPVAPNDTAAGRCANRRVEIRLVPRQNQPDSIDPIGRMRMTDVSE